MHKVLETYFGGKNGSGTFQQIVNQIRPHERYIEPFLGGGAVMLRKKKAQVNIGNDLCKDVFNHWNNKNFEWLTLYKQDAILLLKRLEFNWIHPTVIYLDPPYPLSSRKSARPVYQYKMTDRQHIELLEVAKALPCDVLISTYPNSIYKQMLKDWHCISFQSATRQGPAQELLYMNYENKEGLLHDYCWLGKDFTDRQRIKRKIEREVKKLQSLPAPERNAIIEAIMNNR